jgi:hypothetical protein
MVFDLLSRQRGGSITLTDADNRLIVAMLPTPCGGATAARATRRTTTTFPYWGFQKAAPDDLDRLINYTLTRLNPADTASIVEALQHVDPDQQRGVWGASPAMAPGLVARGPRLGRQYRRLRRQGQRYTLAVMNDLGNAGGYDDGVATTTRVSELLPAGLDAA